MNLTLLHRTPELTLYHDSWNNWLFLDWQGALTLAGVQQASLALLGCCPYPYQRVLNSNAGVTHVPEAVTAWVEQELLPLLGQVGVEQLAWVCAPAPACRRMAEQAQARAWPLRLAVFEEPEAAVEWLQRTRPEPAPAPRTLLAQARQQALAPHTQQFRRRVAAQLAAGS